MRGLDIGEVEAAGEVVAVGVDEADAQLGVVLQLGVGERELVQQPEVGCVALLRPVEPDAQHVPVTVDGDPGVGFVARRHRPSILSRAFDAGGLTGCDESSAPNGPVDGANLQIRPVGAVRPR
jgi:hypothetical protein